MRVLLDECIDRRLARDLVGYEVCTVPQMGWAGTLDRDLLPLVESEFDVFIGRSQFAISAKFSSFRSSGFSFGGTIESFRGPSAFGSDDFSGNSDRAER